MEEVQRKIQQWVQDGDKTKILDLSFYYLNKLPNNLPSELKKLDCSSNQLTQLDNLPSGLKKLVCFVNQLTQLDNLPRGLKKLFCPYNQLIQLDNLPSGLKALYCYYNQLIQLDNLPSELQELSCHNNQVEIHICNPKICSCYKFERFYKTKILTTKYNKYYEEVLSDFIHEPNLAPLITEYLDIPYKRCYTIYS